MTMMNGVRQRPGEELPSSLRKGRSFRDVSEVRFDIPLGPWPSGASAACPATRREHETLAQTPWRRTLAEPTRVTYLSS
jgi:hypothetical protein